MNYGAAKAQFQALLNRRDITPSLVTNFMNSSLQRVQRVLRIPAMEKALIITVGSDFDGLTIPGEFLQLISLTANGTQLRQGSLDEVLKLQESGEGNPRLFHRLLNKIIVGPNPSNGTQFRMDFIADFGEFSSDEDEPTILEIAPDLVIYGALVFAANYYLDQRLSTFENTFQTLLMEYQAQAYDDAIGGGAAISPAYSFQ